MFVCKHPTAPIRNAICQRNTYFLQVQKVYGSETKHVLPFGRTENICKNDSLSENIHF